MKDTAMRLSPLIACFVITAVFLLLYHLIITDLVSSYAGGAYANLPPPLKLIDSFSIQSLALSNFFAVPPYVIALLILGICGAALLFFGFGPASLADPILSIILIAPWLGEVFIVHNILFTFMGNQYYSYGIGGAVVAALLGLRILVDRKQKAYSFFKVAKLNLIKFDMQVFFFSVLLLLVSFAVLYPITLTYIQAPQIFSFAPASLDYTQMSNALNSIPINSSVMTQPLIYAHLYRIRDLELTPGQKLPGFIGSGLGYFNVSLYWFRPEYVVIDPSLSDYNVINGSSFNIYGYMGGNYTLVNSSDGLLIYRIRNASTLGN